jgi:hypothetical protein
MKVTTVQGNTVTGTIAVEKLEALTKLAAVTLIGRGR